MAPPALSGRSAFTSQGKSAAVDAAEQRTRCRGCTRLLCALQLKYTVKGGRERMLDRPGCPPLSSLGNLVSEGCWHRKPSALRSALPRSSLGLWHTPVWGSSPPCQHCFFMPYRQRCHRLEERGRNGRVCHCEEQRSLSRRRQEASSVCGELEDQERSGGGTSPPWPWLQPSLHTRRQPDPDPLAVVSRVSLQHPCPGTERGTGVRGELRAGPSPRKGSLG